MWPMPSIEQWRATWKQLGVSFTQALTHDFDDLIARYSEPHRKYHTVRHLDECFAKLAEIRDYADRPAEVEVALWFHDAVYEQRSTQNEAKSAALAVKTIRTAGGSPECGERVSALIMATRHAAIPQDNDAKVLVSKYGFSTDIERSKRFRLEVEFKVDSEFVNQIYHELKRINVRGRPLSSTAAERTKWKYARRCL